MPHIERALHARWRPVECRQRHFRAGFAREMTPGVVSAAAFLSGLCTRDGARWSVGSGIIERALHARWRPV
jgi:hypothetical protein